MRSSSLCGFIGLLGAFEQVQVGFKFVSRYPNLKRLSVTDFFSASFFSLSSGTK